MSQSIPLEEAIKKYPIVVGNISGETCWCGPTFRCSMCRSSRLNSVIFHFPYWKNGEKIELSDVCVDCTRSLMKQDHEYSSREFWTSRKSTYYQYLEIGLLDPFEDMRFDEEKVAIPS